ncbi:relaxase domain-containing protein, partial [Endobacter medicaginis]|nr:relaxase domain-containing protein [Endobacter medicaginis]
RASLARLGYTVEAAELADAAARAQTAKDYTSATAAARADLEPELARRLAIPLDRGLTAAEVANLLNGQRADGADIEGKSKQAAVEGVGTTLGFDQSRLPLRSELEHVLAGRRADGGDLDPKDAKTASARFLAALGAKADSLTDIERENVLGGRTVSGAELSAELYHSRLDTGRARIGYVDLTFSAPKSVSVAWAFAPTDAERGIILQAHHDAIAATMKDIEATIGRARKGQGGRDGYDPGSIAWVSFDHYAARPTVEVIRKDAQGRDFTELHTMRHQGGRIAGDMQLHTHTAVMNAVLTPEGRMGGLWLDQLDGRVKEWGAVYQAYLATNLRRHGVDMVLDARTEMARVAAVPESVSEAFSKRTMGGTAAARAYAAENGIDWDALAPERKIALIKQGVQDPRGAKSDDISDMQAWRAAAEDLGYRHRSILRPDQVAAVPDRAARLETAYEAAQGVLDKQLQRRASLDSSDARIAAAKGLIASGIEDAADVSAVTAAMRERGVQQHGRRTGLIWGQVDSVNGRERIGITTALHESEERDVVGLARAAAADTSASLTKKAIEKALADHPEIDLSTAHGKAQRAMMDQLGTGGRVAAGIGVAGSGKSTLLKPLVTAWKAQGRDVHGIALAWRQSDDLGEAGIVASKTRAVDAFLRGIERGKIDLTKKSVVVVDELGLLGTRQLLDLLQARERHGFQLVGIGDPKQMQSVEAGATIGLLRRALGDEKLTTLESSVRQVTAEERETTLMFREGRAEEAVGRKAANGTLRVAAGGYDEAVAAVVDLWRERREANADRDRFSLSISAPTNADAHAISIAIRDERRRAGEIGADLRTIRATSPSSGANEGRSYDMGLAVGDRVRLFVRANAKWRDTGSSGNIGRNGSVLEIREVTDDGLVLRGANGRDGLVAWKSLTDKSSGRILLAYGDVLTTNTSQGATVSEHIFAMPAGSRAVNAFGAYSSGSRHREQSFIVTSDGAERAEVAGRRPLGDRRAIELRDVLGNVARNFARQPEKEGALDLLDRARAIRRGTVKDLQQTTQRIQQREVDGEAPTTLSQGAARRRDETLVSRSLGAVRRQMKRQSAAVDRVRGLAAQVAARVRAVAAQRRAEKEKAARKVRTAQKKTRKSGLR